MKNLELAHFFCAGGQILHVPFLTTLTVLLRSQHPFVAQGGLTWRLAVDLLDKMNNPDNHQHYTEVDDDDLEVTAALQSVNKA